MERLNAGPRLRWRRALVRLLFSALALAAVLAVVDLDSLGQALRRVSLQAWLTALLGFMGLHALSALKWRFVLQLTGLEIPAGLTLRAYGFGLFANLCLPSLIGGDVIRAGIIMKHGARKEAVVFAALTDRLLDMVALASLVGLGFLLAPTAFDRISDLTDTQKNLISTGAGLVVLGAVALPFILRRLRPRSLPRKAARVWLGFIRAWRGLLSSPSRAVMALLWCILLQAGFVSVNIYLGENMGLMLDPRLWFLLWPLAKIAAMAPVSLGGIGVREVAFVALAGTFADKDLLLAQSLTWESTLVAGGVLFGALSLIAGRSKGAADA